MKKPTFFGVRHLSPAAAFHLRRALDQAQPRLVLVEGPSDLNGQMAWLCHPETKFPAAILAYTKTPPVRTVLWPFAIYSPEVQAILWAHEHGVECRFMDLPSSVFLALREAEEMSVGRDAPGAPRAPPLGELSSKARLRGHPPNPSTNAWRRSPARTTTPSGSEISSSSKTLRNINPPVIHLAIICGSSQRTPPAAPPRRWCGRPT